MIELDADGAGERAPAKTVKLEHGLVAAMRKRTHALHAQAERSGIVNEILRGRSTRFGYALFLQNLMPAYREMEDGLSRRADAPAIGAVARSELYRSCALEADLACLQRDETWQLPLLPAGERYRRQVARAAEGDGSRLVAHAYARYLGDLSGGQILKRLLARTMHLEPEALSFYDFPAIADADAFKTAYRKAIDEAADDIPDVGAVIEEAAAAFQLNIALSDAVLAHAQASDRQASTVLAAQL